MSLLNYACYERMSFHSNAMKDFLYIHFLNVKRVKILR